MDHKTRHRTGYEDSLVGKTIDAVRFVTADNAIEILAKYTSITFDVDFEDFVLKPSKE